MADADFAGTAKSSKGILRLREPWRAVCLGKAKKDVTSCFFRVDFGEQDRPGLRAQLGHFLALCPGADD